MEVAGARGEGRGNQALTAEIVLDSLLEGARRAQGRVAVIDVFRAFSTAAVAFAGGAERIIMVASVEEALSLRARGIAQACMGEVGGRKPPEFDFGNSPAELAAARPAGWTIAQRTSAGTQGIVAAAQGAERLYAAAFVTASATARALAADAAARISIVAMGHEGVRRTEEDELCALHLLNRLQGREGDPEAVRRVVLAGGEAARFRASPHLDFHDIEIALDIDRYDFALRVTLEEHGPTARPERPA